ncbi:MAG: aldehyde dehydrogenase family protein [Bacteroidota bacterium]
MADRISVQKTYKTYIGGKFPRTESGRTYKIYDQKENWLANACQCSRKDFRDAVVAARGAFSGWSQRTAYNRGQILYRIAEMLEGRTAQFVDELQQMGYSKKKAREEVQTSIDRLIYYAGWSDKYQQIFSTVNPVASAHFNFSKPEPTGVVAIMCPDEAPLLGLVSLMAPAIVGGNTCVMQASQTAPLISISFAEVLDTSDVPGGVVNILTGYTDELYPHFASHMDVNALIYTKSDEDMRKDIDETATENLKRVFHRPVDDWNDAEICESPYWIQDTQEIKTTWHPVGS